MTYTFTLDTDPEDQECISVFLHNGMGASAEIAGRIHYSSIAISICATLNAWSQEKIKALVEGTNA